MCSECIVQVQNVSKIYPERSSLVSLREEGLRLMHQTCQGFFTRTPGEPIHQGFTALKDINFEIQQGESIAFVGRNGSGKTTLIRLLANIMRPTTGNIAIHGRYVALIGLGTGFIPDMTGRENIYLNAAIYGVPPREIDEIIAEIIAFADIGDFVNRRVREYSSGMTARLGFSVAVHILPDIIMVDEALSVGDVGFQHKCNQKIDELLSENRTLILVSHSEDSVKRLCKHAIWLHQGEMKMHGAVDDVLKEYNAFMTSKKEVYWA